MPSDILQIRDEDHHTFITVADAKRLVQMAVQEAVLRIARAPRPFKIFGLNASQEFAREVAELVGKQLTPHEEKFFEDGESYVKPTSKRPGNVRGHNVFVIQSLYSDDVAINGTQRLNRLLEIYAANHPDRDLTAIPGYIDVIADFAGESVSDKFMKLCIMCGALKDASAHEIVAVIPHLAWMRQDRKTASRAPIVTKIVAQILESIGVTRCLFIDAHNLAAEQNAFRIPVDNLETRLLHADWIAKDLVARYGDKLPDELKVCVLTPDSGGLSRCMRLRNALVRTLQRKTGRSINFDIPVVIFDKTRIRGRPTGGRIIGDVKDADVYAADDIISTGGTMEKACRTAIAEGANLRGVCASHGLFCGTANDVFRDLDAPLVVADTVVPFRLNEQNRQKIVTVSTTKMVADAITKIHSGTGSISQLLEFDDDDECDDE